MSNNSKKYEIEIKPDVVNYIEGLNFECNSRKDIITFMLDKNMDIASETFQKYHKEYSEFLVQFQQAKDALEKANMPTEFQNHQTKWELNYETGIMTFEKLCDC